MRNLAILSIVLFSFSLSAQDVHGGLKAGVNFVDVNVDEFDPNQAYSTLEGDRRGVGYHGGFFVRVELPGFFIQPELVYTQMHQTLTAEGTGDNRDIDIDFNRLDVPILAGLGLGPVRLGAGPVASFNLHARDDVFDESLKGATWGYQVGAGVDIESLTLDVRYEGPFSNTANHVVIDGDTYTTDARANQIIVSVGVKLF